MAAKIEFSYGAGQTVNLLALRLQWFESTPAQVSPRAILQVMAQLASAGINITIKQQNQTTSVRRGHRCVTNLLCAENCSLLLMVERAEALGAFAKALREHGGDPSQIEAIAMDMSPAYVKGATEHFPQARIVNNLAAVLKCSDRRSRGYIFTWDLSKNRRF